MEEQTRESFSCKLANKTNIEKAFSELGVGTKGLTEWISETYGPINLISIMFCKWVVSNQFLKFNRTVHLNKRIVSVNLHGRGFLALQLERREVNIGVVVAKCSTHWHLNIFTLAHILFA